MTLIARVRFRARFSMGEKRRRFPPAFAEGEAAAVSHLSPVR